MQYESLYLLFTRKGLCLRAFYDEIQEVKTLGQSDILEIKLKNYKDSQESNIVKNRVDILLVVLDAYRIELPLGVLNE